MSYKINVALKKKKKKKKKQWQMLKQKSADWVCARKDKIGVSEVSALTGKSSFETPRTLLKKKVQSPPMHNNVACAWGSLFEPIARKYFEKKHSVSVFGHTASLNLAENDQLFGKITFSPDGYFLNSDNELVLLEFKCPFSTAAFFIKATKISATFNTLNTQKSFFFCFQQL